MRKDYYFRKTSAINRNLFYNRQLLKDIKNYKKVLENHLYKLGSRLSLSYTYKNSGEIVKVLRKTLKQAHRQSSEELVQIKLEIKEITERIKVRKNSPYYYNCVGQYMRRPLKNTREYKRVKIHLFSLYVTSDRLLRNLETTISISSKKEITNNI